MLNLDNGRSTFKIILCISISLNVKSENGLCCVGPAKIFSKFDKEVQLSKMLCAI